MPEEIINVPTDEQKIVAAEQSVGDGFWGASSGAAANVDPTTTEADKNKTDVPIDTKATEQKEAVIVGDESLKTNLGYDSWDVAKQEIAELRKLKETAQTKEEIKFANEQSEKIFKALKEGKEDEVFEIMATKRQIAKAEKLDTNDPKQASELIKLNLQLKYPTLESYDISDLYNEQYSKPDKPKQGTEQSDEEYADVLTGWQVRCDAIDRKIMRDAKIAKPEISEKNSQIVYPDIPKAEAATTELSQEELGKITKAISAFGEQIDAEFKTFNGFDVAVKDGDVEIASSYTLTPEEKVLVAQKLKSFAQQGFDPNALLAERWVNKETNTLNVQRIVRDVTRLEFGDKMDQKFVQDASAKRLKEYTREKKHIELEGVTTRQSNGQPDLSKAMEAVESAVWS